ncbi:MAG TPA: hypothetical protein PKA20_12435 [Burkholderiaceae bacterium]|nr:hypothetical protein [Burkholderiaceae bacterium]
MKLQLVHDIHDGARRARIRRDSGITADPGANLQQIIGACGAAEQAAAAIDDDEASQRRGACEAWTVAVGLRDRLRHGTGRYTETAQALDVGQRLHRRHLAAPSHGIHRGGRRLRPSRQEPSY